MRTVMTLALKDLRLLLRDKGSLFWVIGFPLLMALFFGSIFSGMGGGDGFGSLKIAVVDDDHTEASFAFANDISTSDALKVVRMPLDSARQAVRKGQLAAYVRIKPGFEEGGMFFADSATLEFGMDPARRAEAGFLEGMITQIWFQQMQRQLMNPTGLRERLKKTTATIPHDTTMSDSERSRLSGFLSGLDQFMGTWDSSLFSGSSDSSESGGGFSMMQGPKIERVDIAENRGGPRSAYEITFPSAILWGLIGCVSTFSVSIVVERNGGTYTRLRLAPISNAQILAGKGMACLLASVAVSLLLLLLAGTVFSVRLSNIAGLTLAIGATSLCFVGLMMLISVMGKTEQSVGGGGMAILLVFAMLGGGMIPLMIMPEWMLTVSNVSPVKWGILALEGAIWRGFSLTEMLLPVGILLGIGAFAFAIGATILSRADS